MLLTEITKLQAKLKKKNYVPQKTNDFYSNLAKLDPNKGWYDQRNDPNSPHDYLGGGAYADAHASKEEPGTAIKTVRPQRNLNQDSYYVYLKMLASHPEDYNNRYFPKVYDINVFTTKKGHITYKVDMERLQPFDDLLEKEATAIGNHIFENFEQLNQSSYRNYPKATLISCIGTALGGSNRQYNNIDVIIKDEEFAEAARMLTGLINRIKGVSMDTNGRSKRHLSLDIHTGNVMVRRGPFMPQLVLTDPVS